MLHLLQLLSPGSLRRPHVLSLMLWLAVRGCLLCQFSPSFVNLVLALWCPLLLLLPLLFRFLSLLWVVVLPVRGSSALSPGPSYQGPDPDPSLMVWPLSEFPDWPINDDWRDFAFEPVVFRVRPFFSESSLPGQSNNNNDYDGP